MLLPDTILYKNVKFIIIYIQRIIIVCLEIVNKILLIINYYIYYLYFFTRSIKYEW